MTPATQNQTQVDVTIVGASYAGMTCALACARRGLRVVVLDKKPNAGARPHTTGIFVKEAVELLQVPEKYLRKINGIRLYSPDLHHVDLHSPDYYFMAADTPGFLDWYADYGKREGIDVRFNTNVRDVYRENHKIVLPEADVESAFLVGADGPRSTVAEKFGLGLNRDFLVGMELEYSGVQGVDENYLHVFLDSDIAPGYIAWVVPGVGITQVGLARNHPGKLDVDGFVEKIKTLFDFNHAQMIGRRGGLIPVGGRVKRFAEDNVLLVGDAAGVVSPLTAGGIHRAFQLGERAGYSIAEYLQDSRQKPARTLRSVYPSYFWKKQLRRIAKIALPNFLFNFLLRQPFFRAFAQLVFFHHRGLFSKAAWRDLLRITTGSSAN